MKNTSQYVKEIKYVSSGDRKRKGVSFVETKEVFTELPCHITGSALIKTLIS